MKDLICELNSFSLFPFFFVFLFYMLAPKGVRGGNVGRGGEGGARRIRTPCKAVYSLSFFTPEQQYFTHGDQQPKAAETR